LYKNTLVDLFIREHAWIAAANHYGFQNKKKKG